MRRHYWLLAPFLLWACSEEDDDDALYEAVTSVNVTPAAFLGDQACRTSGGLQRYQATLIDVTAGLDEAFTLPSSRVVSCNSAISFEFVAERHRYIATIAAFNRSDISAQNPGSPVIIDGQGKSVVPDWTTTCWGDDRVDYSSVSGMGGAAPDEMGGTDGAGGELELGVIAYENATTIVRGCDPLTGDRDLGPTGVTIDIEPLLLGLECGNGPGQVDHFTVYPNEPREPSSPAGGAGGMGGGDSGADGSLGTAQCGEVLTIDGLTPSEHTSFFVEAFESAETESSWTTLCAALTVPGVIVPTSCDPISDL